MKLTRLRIAYTIVMSGLTGIAVTACRWQWRRHKESKARWSIIEDEMSKFNPSALTSTSEPYRLARIRGKFETDQIVKVMRVKDGRMGHLIIKPFRLTSSSIEGASVVYVNLGWVPDDQTFQNDEIDASKEMGKLMRC